MGTYADTLQLTEGYVQVEVGRRGHAHEESVEFRFDIVAQRSTLTIVKVVAKDKNLDEELLANLSRDDFDHAARTLLSIFLKPETPYGVTCTTHYFGNISWKLGDDEGSRSVQSEEQEDIDLDWLLEVAGKSENAASMEKKIEKIKREGYTNWAHRLFRVSETLLRRMYGRRQELWNAVFGKPKKLTVLEREDDF